MKAALAYPSWDQIDGGVARLALAVERLEYFTPTLIVGLSRGGLIPAVRMSHMVGGDVKFAAVSYSAPKGNGETDENVGGNTTSLMEVINFWNHLEEKQVLIVDDIVDTGHTMAFVSNAFVEAGWHTATACLHLREGSVFTPTLTWQTISEEDPWIVYPWEL